ncbi:DGQHR domain-containing protein [Pontiellaceae bacterium B1224]|nr:DGQHR domain-containing protein [Pontiellaceae bacterium B1224]
MSETLSYLGTRIKQRQSVDCPYFFTFYASVSEITQWAGVKRTEEQEHGAQRVTKPARLASITRFLEARGDNTLPGSIIIGFKRDSISFSPDTNFDISNRCQNEAQLGSLDITFDPTAPTHEKPGLIVDGQHRVFGSKALHNEDVPLLIVGILDADIEEQAFQFIVINQKSSKVPTTNVKSIIADIESINTNLGNRLEAAGIRYGENTPTLKRFNSEVSSPFYKLLDWELNDRDTEAKRIVTVTAIEACIRQLQSSFESLLDDTESAESVFLTVWSTLKSNYEDLWNDDSGNKFLKKVNIVAINEYLTHSLLMEWAKGDIDPLEESEVQEFVLGIFSSIPKEFWTREWKIKIQDNSNVRDLIKGDLETMLVNVKLQREWTKKLKLISQQ